MFYVQYLSSLCQRRQWPEPLYSPASTRAGGYACVVRVNNREYHTDRAYTSEVQATENAAMRAYLICRNFSVNDGRYPTSHTGSRGAQEVQGRPVAIGTERRHGQRGSSGSNGSNGYSSSGSRGSSSGGRYYDDSSSGSRSGGSSPGSAEFPASHRDNGGRSQRRSGAQGGGRVLTYGGSRRR